MARMVLVLVTAVWAIGLSWQARAHEPESADAPPEKGRRPFHILKQLPLDPEWYHADAAALVRLGVPEKYGHEEWASVVLTHELHQHVGIYTVLGAKMGVRARELLGAPTRAVRVTVETGTEPPTACAIDGIQVALGSTLAQNLIKVKDESRPRIAASFEYEGRRLRLALREEYQERISGYIKAASDKHGFQSHEYFHEIERLAYEVWAKFDRRAIFVEEWDAASSSEPQE